MTAAETKLTQQTYGLLTADEFKAKQDAIAKEEEARLLEEQNRAEAEALKAALAEAAPPPPPPPKKSKVAPPKQGALSFSFDDEGA